MILITVSLKPEELKLSRCEQISILCERIKEQQLNWVNDDSHRIQMATNYIEGLYSPPKPEPKLSKATIFFLILLWAFVSFVMYLALTH